MFNFLKSNWFVVIEQRGTTEIVPKREAFIAREWTAWKAFDVVKEYATFRERKDKLEWIVVSMTRV